MRNKLGNALIALGVLALLAAVLLMGYNLWDSTRAEKGSRWCADPTGGIDRAAHHLSR